MAVHKKTGLPRNGSEAGDVFCRDSVRCRSFENDLLDDEHWQQKEAPIGATGLTILQQPIQEHLAGLEQQLESRPAEVNRRLAAGENEHFQIKRPALRSLDTSISAEH